MQCATILTIITTNIIFSTGTLIILPFFSQSSCLNPLTHNLTLVEYLQALNHNNNNNNNYDDDKIIVTLFNHPKLKGLGQGGL